MPFAIDRTGIVGATGFIGRALVANLVSEGRGCPRLFGRSTGAVAGCAVEPLGADPAAFAGLDCVVHLAAIIDSRAPSQELQSVNVDLAVRVAQMAIRSGVRRMVFVSSIGVHGKSAIEPVRPDAPLGTDNAYGRSKISAERALQTAVAGTTVELVILRPPMVYGPGNRGSFDLLARLVRSGAPLPLGRAREPRSFCSIDNLVSAICHVIEVVEPPPVLIPADPADIDTRTLVREIALALGRPARLLPAPKAMVLTALSILGRREMSESLFEPMRVDRSHWEVTGWHPPQSTAAGIRAALNSCPDAPLVLYVTTSTPYFFSHRAAVAHEAQARGFRIAVAGGDVSRHEAQYKACGFLPIQIPGGARGIDPVGDLRAGWAIAGEVRKRGVSIVHASGLKTIFLCALAALRRPLPRTICIVTGLGALYVNHSKTTRLIRRGVETIIGPLLRGPRTIAVFQNGDDYEHFVSHRLARRESSVLIRGSGVDTAEFAYRSEPVREVPVVVFPARLLKSKGVVEFATAAAFVNARGVSARFVLVGDIDPDNPDSLSGEDLASLVAKGHVEAWGFQKDMASVFASCSLVCLPSYREGVPKALIEAASTGRAIVTTDVPGCREIVEDGRNGLLVPPANSEALAEALIDLITHPKRRKEFGAAGRARVEEEFGVELVVQRTADLYGLRPDRTETRCNVS